MFFLALIGKVERGDFKNDALQENIKNTSLAAAVQPNMAEQLGLEPQSVFSIDSFPAVIIPKEKFSYRKDWDLPAPALKVKAALAKDLDFGADFHRLNTLDRWPLASLTKLLTAAVALEEMDKEKIVTVSKFAVDSEGPAGNLEVGDQYSVADLLKAILIVSSNDAATAVAESYGTKDFIDKMKEKANLLGMGQSNFVDPTGISFLDQGSIEDLEKLVFYIYKNHPEIFRITAEKNAALSELGKGKKNELLNINNFAADSRPDFYGGKTGFTDQALGNLISIFEYNGHKILVIVLGTDDRFGQTEILYDWVKKAYSFN